MSETPAAPATTSRWEDFIDVFISPAELFRRRADGRFGQALLVLVIVTAVMYFATRSAMQPIYEAGFARGMTVNPNLTHEQIETARNLALTLAPVIVLIGVPIGAFILGGVIWLAARAVGGRVSYAQGATIATFAFFPRVIEGIVGAVQALLMDEGRLTSRFSVSVGVGRFLNPETTNAMLLTVLGRIDLFTLWGTALCAVGLKKMAGTSTGQAVAGAGLVWLIATLPALLQGLRAG